jgi:hypothetical protein
MQHDAHVILFRFTILFRQYFTRFAYARSFD